MKAANGLQAIRAAARPGRRDRPARIRGGKHRAAPAWGQRGASSARNTVRPSGPTTPWSGPITHQPGRNGSSYYRIQGPRLLIEFSPQGVGGDPTLHVHTVYRDPTNEYGIAYTLR